MLSCAGSSRGSRLLPLLLAGLILMAATPSFLFAQAVTGTLLGTVSDSTGAVIAGAKVTVTNQNTGFTRTVKTDGIGEYTVPSIPTGIYTVLAEMDGFKATALSQVEVGVDQRAQIDVKLEVGAMTESVTIEAQSPLVQTSSSELGTTVKDEQIQALPLNGRNFVSLTRGVPGVLRGIPGANIDGAGSLAWRASASFSANGQRSRDNNYMLDGVDNNETWLQTVVIFPSVDALDEFKLQTSTYSAEFGRSLGGVVNLQIKSGTNSFRGSVFEFHRNDAFDANNFFNNRAGRKKPDFKQNQFGGTLWRSDLPGQDVLLRRLPGTPGESGPDVPVDRAVERDAGRQLLGDDAASSTTRRPDSRFRATSFRGPDGTMSPPHPHATLPDAQRRRHAQRGVRADDQQLPDQPDQGAAGQPVRREDRSQPVDQQPVLHPLQLQQTHRVQPATLPHGDAGATFGAGDGNIHAQSLAFNDTHTLSSNWLNEFRFGWSQIEFLMTPIDYGTNPARAVGIPNINNNEVTSAMTQLGFQNIRNLGANSNQPLITNQNDFQIFDNVTWIKGKHTLKAGGSLTLRSREILNADTIVGNFSFNNNMTSNCAGQTVRPAWSTAPRASTSPASCWGW